VAPQRGRCLDSEGARRLRGLKVLRRIPKVGSSTWGARRSSGSGGGRSSGPGWPLGSPTTLRHSFASILLSRGANILAIQKAGGWRSAQVLLQVYAKWIGGGRVGCKQSSKEASKL